jgi:poly(hydroxyalkanoate) depolymerase family esterase
VEAPFEEQRPGKERKILWIRKLDFMKTEMDEAARLTREGRLAEATALIRRSLGLGAAPADASGHFADVPQIDVTSIRVNEPAALELPPATGAETRPEPPAQAETDRLTSFHRAPGVPALHLSALAGLPMPDILSKLPARDPSRRRFPAEVVAPTTGHWTTGAYTGESGRRAYKLYLPSGYHSQPLPLVVMLHGCTQSADDFAAGTRMNFLAEAQGLLIVYPEQATAANGSRCWNWFQPADQERAQGEPALIAGITRLVMAEHHVDADRVYITGLSAGGAMAAILAATYPDLFAAVGVHSGLAPGSAHDLASALHAMQGRGLGGRPGAPGRAIPLILFQGDRDSTVHPGNAEEFIRHWGGALGQPRVSLRQGQVAGGRAYSCAAYQDLSGQTFVERWTVHGAGHAWSGGSRNGSFTDPAGPDASREMVRFFREHPRTPV